MHFINSMRCLAVAIWVAWSAGCVRDEAILTGTASTPSWDIGFDPWEHGPSNTAVIGPFFAPFIFQDIDWWHQDALTNFTYDGDWMGGNNWDNLWSYPTRSYVYASIVETGDFYFVTYSLFHPRDWSASKSL